MYKLTLIKGRSYHGGKNGSVFVTMKNPSCVVETQEEAEALVATGYFSTPTALAADEAVTGNPVSDGEPENDGEPATKPFVKMTKAELLAFAEEHDIDLSECGNNETRIAKIQAALAADENQMKVDFGEGSETMKELQEN